MSKRDEQIARMKGLMTYGIGSTSKKTPVTESFEGPDGNVYAILREGTKFYIKSTPKGSELVAESFDYIGGYMNKKNNEYSSYNQASKNLELKIRSLNEAYGINKPVEILNPDKKEILMVEMTESMKNSIARYRQIINNACGIMKESSDISASNTGNPEALKTTNFSPKLGNPFINNAEAELDKDLEVSANNPEKQGKPFGDSQKAEEYKDAQYVPNGSVANQHPSGGKVVRVNENSEYEETVEECDEWGSCGVPTVPGVGDVDDAYPFDEELDENNFFHNNEVSDEEQLPDLPDEICLEEGTEEYVGFADDESFNEDEESEDIDLDDIDVDLDSDSDEVEDNELDDIDTEEFLSDNEEDSEIEALKNEIEELRQMVLDLTDENEDDDVEFELDLTDEDEDDEDDANVDDEIDESCKRFKSLTESKVRLPFEINREALRKKLTWINAPESRYGLYIRLKRVMEKVGGTEEDAHKLNLIRNKMLDIIRCEFELNECKKNECFDDEIWSELILNIESTLSQIGRIVDTISFLSIENGKPVYNGLNALRNNLGRLIKFYDENINPDANQDDYEEEDDDVSDEMVDTNNDEIEDDVESDDEIDKEAWKNASKFNDFNLNISDDMYESVNRRKVNENRTRLNVWGKHPRYQAKAMSLPKTGVDKSENYKDWNDDSVYSEEPFGSKIGSSEPYNKVVDSIVESVLNSLKKKI